MLRVQVEPLSEIKGKSIAFGDRREAGLRCITIRASAEVCKAQV